MTINADTVPAMKPRVYVAVVGFVLIAVAVFVGFSSVTVPLSDGRPADCGSAFNPSHVVTTEFFAPRGTVQPRERCPGAVSSRRTLAFVVFGAGILVTLGATVKRQETPA